MKAKPLPLSTPEPMLVNPSKNWTLPVGVGPLLLTTFACSVTLVPTVALLFAEVSTIVVFA